MCFLSVEENMKTRGSVAVASGYHILPKPGSDLAHGTVAGKRLLSS